MTPYPPAARGQVVVWGLLAASPFGGMIWQVVHYLVGLRRLGFDVWYVEDSRIWPRDPTTWAPTADAAVSAVFVAATMRAIGLHDRWVLRVPGRTEDADTIRGAMDAEGLRGLYRSAEAVFNLCGSHFVRDDHAEIRKLVMVETDPGHAQVSIANGHVEKRDQYARHHHLFTYGENVGHEQCGLPTAGFVWLPTRPPVAIEVWEGSGPPRAPATFSTVAAWRSRGKDVEWGGERWAWSKHHEFERLLALPSRTRARLEIAIEGTTNDDVDSLLANGWHLRPAMALAGAEPYRDYIRSSAGEFTAAKEQYVKPRSGWFSDRSVCYLAAGRPVVVQDTGIRRLYPTGEGLLTFGTLDEAASCLESVLADPERHGRAAAEIAREHFRAETVIGSMLERIGLL